jgi:hypothetical protein
MKKTYNIKYRIKGRMFWRTIKNVRGDEVIFGRLENGIRYDPLFRAFVTDDNSIHYVPLDAEVIFPPDRQSIVASDMSREIGQPVQTV